MAPAVARFSVAKDTRERNSGLRTMGNPRNVSLIWLVVHSKKGGSKMRNPFPAYLSILVIGRVHGAIAPAADPRGCISNSSSDAGQLRAWISREHHRRL